MQHMSQYRIAIELRMLQDYSSQIVDLVEKLLDIYSRISIT